MPRTNDPSAQEALAGRKYTLVLKRSASDAGVFSSEFQDQLREMAALAKPSAQVAFTMDAIGAGGGGIGEFLFTHGEALLVALLAIGSKWVEGRSGRKIRVKFGDLEIEAGTTSEVEKLMSVYREHQTKLNDRD